MPATNEGPRNGGHGELTSAISTATVHLLREHTGRGPTRAKTHLSQDLITVVLKDTLTKGERTLVDSGRSEDVLRTRHIFQETMKPALVAEVERLSGRTVIAFMSQNHIDPDMAVETFVLEPEDVPEEASAVG